MGLASQTPAASWLTPQTRGYLSWAELLIGIGSLAAGLRIGCGIARSPLLTSGLSVFVGLLHLALGFVLFALSPLDELNVSPALGQTRVYGGKVCVGLGCAFLVSAALGFTGRRAYLKWRAGRVPRRSRTLALVGLVIVAGGYRWYQWQPHWHTYTSTAGGFTIELPAPVRPEMADYTEEKWSKKIEGTLLPAHPEEYIVADFSYPRSGYQSLPRVGLRPYPIGPDRVLHSDLPYLLPSSKDRTMNLTEGSVNGHAALDAEFELPDGRIGMVRVIKSNGRMYILSARGPRTDAGKQRCRRFIDSFALVENR